MKPKKADKRWIGILIGILGPLIVLYGVNIYVFAEMNYIKFIKHTIEFEILQTWLKPALLINLAFFMLFINNNMLKLCQGIIFGTIIHGILIIYLTFA